MSIMVALWSSYSLQSQKICSSDIEVNLQLVTSTDSFSELHSQEPLKGKLSVIFYPRMWHCLHLELLGITVGTFMVHDILHGRRSRVRWSAYWQAAGLNCQRIGLRLPRRVHLSRPRDSCNLLINGYLLEPHNPEYPSMVECFISNSNHFFL
jgi:hypothetical protein